MLCSHFTYLLADACFDLLYTSALLTLCILQVLMEMDIFEEEAARTMGANEWEVGRISYLLGPWQ